MLYEFVPVKITKAYVFFSRSNVKLNTIAVTAAGEQGVSIPPLWRGRSAHGHRQHPEHQEHVGEGQRVQLTWKWRKHVQGERVEPNEVVQLPVPVRGKSPIHWCFLLGLADL